MPLHNGVHPFCFHFLAKCDGHLGYSNILGWSGIERERLVGLPWKAYVHHPILFRVAANKRNIGRRAADGLLNLFAHLAFQVVRRLCLSRREEITLMKWQRGSDGRKIEIPV